MSTNYEYRYNICPHCGKYDELHLGLSSGGWRFTFQAHYKNEYTGFPLIKSWADWKYFMKHHTGEIYDEYGNKISIIDFVEMIQLKQKHEYINKGIDHFQDDEDYTFSYEEFC